MDKNTESEEKKEREYPHSFYELARRMMLAGIGAVAMKHDEVEEFIDKLVERGELAKKDRESLIKEMREHRRKYFGDEENRLHKHLDEFLERMNVPAKKDFDDLKEKISKLEEKIDELTKTKE